MLSISNRAIACFTGVALSGCMQTMPTAETFTKPTVEAFTRLSTWTPWRSAPEQPTPLIIRATPNDEPPVTPPVRIENPPADHGVARKPLDSKRQLASSRAKALVRPSAVAAPTPEIVSPILPGKVSCQTSSQPNERVRMECTPIE